MLGYNFSSDSLTMLMKISKIKISNIFFIVVVVLLIIPQTRQPIQVFIHKGFAMFSPSEVDEAKQEQLEDYNWKLQDQVGNNYNFNDAKGQVVMVNFWATWCPPCIAEMPSIMELYNDYKDDVVFMLVTSEDREKVIKFMSKNNYNFVFYNSLTTPPKTLQSTSIPQTYLIDKHGKIVIDKNGAANWNSESVRDALNKLIEAQ